jgi:hypothetical protein
MNNLTDAQLLKAAQEALTRPRDFGYHGDLPLFESWGLTFSQTRDSDALERSNYRRIFEDLKELAGRSSDGMWDDYVQDFRSSHWMNGWMEQIAVRVLEDEDGPVEVDNLTPIFIQAAEIAFDLEDYSIYDEDDLSSLEDEEDWERFDQEWGRMLRSWDEESEGALPTEDEKDAVHAKLNECDTPQGYDEDELAETLKDLRPAPESANGHIVNDPNQIHLF